MLWYKWWLDTQRWFLLGMIMLTAQVVALYLSYPMDPAASYPHGALGVLPQEMAQLRTGAFRGYVWVRWFSTTMLIFWPVFAAALASTGFEETRGREYLLSLPVTRRRMVLARVAMALAQIAAFTVLPTLLVCAMAPLVGQRYPVTDAVVHAAILFVGGLGLFGLALFLRVVATDAAAFMTLAALIVICGLLTFLVTAFTPYSIFRVMNGAEYFFDGRVPWTGLILSAGAGAVLIGSATRIIERRDF